MGRRKRNQTKEKQYAKWNRKVEDIKHRRNVADNADDTGRNGNAATAVSSAAGQRSASCDRPQSSEGGHRERVPDVSGAANAPAPAEGASASQDSYPTTSRDPGGARGINGKIKHKSGDTIISEAQTALQRLQGMPEDQRLQSLLHEHGPLRPVLGSSLFCSQPMPFYETVTSFVARTVGACFWRHTSHCLLLLKYFIGSPIFCDSICQPATLEGFGIDGLMDLVFLLSVAVQELPEGGDEGQGKGRGQDRGSTCYMGLNVLPEESASMTHCANRMRNLAKRRGNAKLLKRVTSLCWQLENERAFAAECIAAQEQLRQREGQGHEQAAYTSLSILPTDEELKKGGQPTLSANKLEGSYSSAQEYIGTHFMLLREDFAAPLRNGVQEFVRMSALGQPFSRLESARLYRDVVIFSNEGANGAAFEFKLNINGSALANWENGKKLQYGSLVALSSDQFWTITLATVTDKTKSDRGAALLGLNVVSGHAQVLTAALGSTFDMIESESYYEGYKYNAAILQRMDLNTLPFRKYLVECTGEPSLPAYAWGTAGRKVSSAPALYDLSSVVRSIGGPRDYRRVDVASLEEWPSPLELGLDASQAEALRAALTQEFAIIQGPPGTGKTYVGTKIVDLLLANEKVWTEKSARGATKTSGGQTILVVCYTNHALDQFLEHIVGQHKDKVVRVGGRSSSEKLNQYNLKELTRRVFARSSEDYYQRKRHVKKLQSQLLAKGKLVTRDEITLAEAAAHLEHRHVLQLGGEDGWRRWVECSDIFEEKQSKKGVSRGDSSSNKSGEAEADQPTPVDSIASEEYQHLSLLSSKPTHSTTPVNSAMPKESATPAADTNWNCEELVATATELVVPAADTSVNDVGVAREYATRKVGVVSSSASGHKNKELKAAKASPLRMTWEELYSVEDVWRLDIDDRCRMHRLLVGECRAGRVREVERINSELSEYEDSLLQMGASAKLPAFNGRPIVGMTITGAAKNSALLQLLKPKIVIVEEAAEVLEAHIITSLTSACQHLILIGDHQQLRPKPAVYDLVRNYNMDVSLFERMVKRHSLPFTCLKVQHRMRPEISKIMTPIFYADLVDHSSVNGRPAVRGIKKNVYFLNHGRAEGHDRGERSHSNEHEARLVAGLCDYLLRQGYEPRQITVLVAYTGQLFAVKGFLQPQLGILVTTVDNYQGEENDIIILSLVRSNEKGSIGFLSTDNRICVALSRARLGFYCFGNFDLLARKSDTWASIAALLSLTNETGNRLPLGCHKHEDQLYFVSEPEDFNTVPSQGCARTCDVALDCGHTCLHLCHRDDPSHMSARRCRQPCNRLCKRGHRCCRSQCCQPCEPCPRDVPRHFLDCGHTWPVPCYSYDSGCLCGQPVPVDLPCGHQATWPCHQARCSESRCNAEGWLDFGGGRHITGSCSKIRAAPCYQKANKTYVPCDHVLIASCHVLQCSAVDGCNEEVFVALESKEIRLFCRDFPRSLCPCKVDKVLPCGHVVNLVCHRSHEPVKCEALCKQKLPGCGHEIEKVCSDSFENLQCKELVDRRLSCGHFEKVLCGSPQLPCMTRVERNLRCGHIVMMACSEPYMNLGRCDAIMAVPLPGCGHLYNKKCREDPDLLAVDCKYIKDKNLACGHITRVLCHEFSLDVKCKAPCDRELPCGHRAVIGCHVNVATVQCKMDATVTLDCRHSYPVPCYMRGTAIQCNETVTVLRPDCGHEVSKPCSEDLASIPCLKRVTKNLRCGHTRVAPCSDSLDGYICPEKMEKRLACGHSVTTSCADDVSNRRCSEKMEKKLACGHVVSCQCGSEPDKVLCDQIVQKILPCGHQTLVVCSNDPEVVACEKEVTKLLPCHHEVRVECRIDTINISCHEPVDKQLPCHHLVRAKCSEDTSSFACQELVDKSLPCGHKKRMRCSETPTSAVCFILCHREADCGHDLRITCHLKRCSLPECAVAAVLQVGQQTPVNGPCWWLRSAGCPVKVQQKLKCGHLVTKYCHDQTEHRCREQVFVPLPCAHKIQSYCHVINCTQFDCREMMQKEQRCADLKHALAICCREKKFERPCSHSVSVPCHAVTCKERNCKRIVAFGSQSVVCHALKSMMAAPCDREVQTMLRCGHEKVRRCSDRCSCTVIGRAQAAGNTARDRPTCVVHTCTNMVTKKLDCGHSTEVRCVDSKQPVDCVQSIDLPLPTCGHAVTIACVQRGDVDRWLCSEESCALRCAHGGCVRPCSKPCLPCTRPCQWACGHSDRRCSRLCFQACDVSACSHPCSRTLPCGHPCMGLCGEECPDVCCFCRSGAARALLRRVCLQHRVPPRVKFLRLLPCGDVVPVDVMDAHVKKHETDIEVAGGRSFRVRPLLCPDCRRPVGRCRRYDGVLKRYFNFKRRIPKGASGEWLGCTKGHVRSFESASCRECDDEDRQVSCKLVAGQDVTLVKESGRFPHAGRLVAVEGYEAVVLSASGEIIVADVKEVRIGNQDPSSSISTRIERLPGQRPSFSRTSGNVGRKGSTEK